jgi:hypothetical protein
MNPEEQTWHELQRVHHTAQELPEYSLFEIPPILAWNGAGVQLVRLFPMVSEVLLCSTSTYLSMLRLLRMGLLYAVRLV